MNVEKVRWRVFHALNNVEFTLRVPRWITRLIAPPLPPPPASYDDLGVYGPLGHKLPCVCMYCELTYGKYERQAAMTVEERRDVARVRDYSRVSA